MKLPFPSVAGFKSPELFARRLEELAGAPMPCDSQILHAPDSPLARPLSIAGRLVGNRFCIHPMEGWDGTHDGGPTEWTLRRWKNFGLSGAKLIWGGEAVAVCHEGRANPEQLYWRPENERGLSQLREILLFAHREKFGSTEDLLIGLQLTHSGRFCRPEDKQRLEPRIVHSHPSLDARFGVDPKKSMMSDGELDALVETFVKAGTAAQEIGFDFVDIKHCHGYLLHELLAAKTRNGRYGGSFENRTRFLRSVVEGLRRDAPGLLIGVRISIFDQPPMTIEMNSGEFSFGLMSGGIETWDRDEPMRFLALCRELGMFAVNITAGSPYYCAHLQRPAAYPPVDSTETRQDPLLGVILQLRATGECTRAVPELPVVGTGYSYLQEYLPHVAQANVREGNVDFIGLGRVVLSYPTLPSDVLEQGALTRGKICRTFSDCTNGPRMGFRSGCYPLDPVYKSTTEWKEIQARKKQRDG